MATFHEGFRKGRSAVAGCLVRTRRSASEVLTVGEMEDLRPGPGEVLVRVHASGVNPGEVKKRSDWMGLGIGFPLERIAKAHEALEGGRSGGRVIVAVG